MLRFVVIAAIILTVHAGFADEAPRTLVWDDLVPAAGPLDNPLIDLTDDQSIEIDTLAAIRVRMARGEISKVDQLYEDGVELTHKLRKDGLDVEDLLQRYENVMLEIERRNEQIVDQLDGKFVRIPGYALPFEMDGTAVTKFLLVPYLGACIHVPPPPVNQMVLVKLQQSYIPETLYAPVWVTGRLKTERARETLSYRDGTDSVETGYTLEGQRIEPYTE